MSSVPAVQRYWHDTAELDVSPEGWRVSLRLACDWALNVSMVKEQMPDLSRYRFQHKHQVEDWRGAFKGEYHAGAGHWDFFCPIWHGGQGVKALALAATVLDEPAYLEAAKYAAEFILRHQVTEASADDFGLILAYESASPAVNCSAILETLEGLFTLARISGNSRYNEAALHALRWVQRKLYLADDGLFIDDYDPANRRVGRPHGVGHGGRYHGCRPLLDDGVFVQGYALTGDRSLLEVAVRTADRLLADEGPAGNWVMYPPAQANTGVIHPRHAFWWGRPMVMLYRVTGDTKYLEAARRSAAWYQAAQRRDGGQFRDTDAGFRTPSFGHATSGAACAALLWCDLLRECGDEQWGQPASKALAFCRSMQFTRANDPNLMGAILEKVIAPAGSDGPPWYLRDIGTFFTIQAICEALGNHPQLLGADA